MPQKFSACIMQIKNEFKSYAMLEFDVKAKKWAGNLDQLVEDF